MTLTLHSNISTVDTDDGRVLLDERTGRYFQLNSSGALILDALATGTDAQQAAHLLTQRYSVAYDRAITDVTALINHLRAAPD